MEPFFYIERLCPKVPCLSYNSRLVSLISQQYHSNHNKFCHADLFEGDSNPYPDIFSVRDILPKDTESTASFLQITKWIDDCTKRHDKCGPGIPKPLPNRILDVGREGEPHVKLCETSAEAARYICLSHCWGDFRSDILTTSTTIEANKRAIALDSLPATYRDAVIVTRRLDVRYLWIDSLCIIQDDLDDWKRESATMSSVYQNAYLTIAATSAVDDSIGLFCNSSAIAHSAEDETTPYPSRERKIEIQNAKSQLHSVYVQNLMRHDWYWDTDQGFPKSFCPLLNRAWCFQERLLSPRVLHYLLNELSWECLESCACQCSPPAHDGLKARHSQDLSCGSETRLRECWYDLVRAYSVLTLSFAKDKLPAISGVAAQMQGFRNTKYLAGLWEDTLLHDLLWTTNPGTRQGHSRANQWRAPSWSWASVDGEVRYDFHALYRMDEFSANIWAKTKSTLEFTVQLFETSCELSGPNPTGEVISGFLRLSGLLCQVNLKVEQTQRKHLKGERCEIFHNQSRLGKFYPDYCIDNKQKLSLYCLRVAETPEPGKKNIRICMILKAINLEQQIYERIGLLVINDESRSALYTVEFLESCVVKEITII